MPLCYLLNNNNLSEYHEAIFFVCSVQWFFIGVKKIAYIKISVLVHWRVWENTKIPIQATVAAPKNASSLKRNYSRDISKTRKNKTSTQLSRLFCKLHCFWQIPYGWVNKWARLHSRNNINSPKYPRTKSYSSAVRMGGNYLFFHLPQAWKFECCGKAGLM